MNRNMYVYIITTASILAVTILLIGFGWTIGQHTWAKQAKPIEKSEESEQVENSKGKKIVAIGDSLTRGTGDVEGKGYVGYLVEELQDKTKDTIELNNLGVKGYRSEQLLAQLQEDNIQSQIKIADYILITIGGNDLFQGGQSLLNPNLDTIATLRGPYLANIKSSLDLIKGINQEATILFVGLYNPFIDLSDAATTTAAVREWNYETNKLIDQYPNVVFVPTFDLFQLKVNDYLYSDKFHPNTKGYQLIAERVASLITW